jgi:hypothetical protein
MDWQAVEGSFRDPSGFVYTRDGITVFGLPPER